MCLVKLLLFRFGIIILGCYNPHFTPVGIKSAADVHSDDPDLHHAVSTDGFSALGRSCCPPASAAADSLVGQTRLRVPVVPAFGNPARGTAAPVLHCCRALSLRCPRQPGPQFQLLRTGVYATTQAHTEAQKCDHARVHSR